MQCATCDIALAENARYCSNCGTAASSGPGTWRSAVDDDIRAARAFAADARQRHALPDTLGASMAKGAAIGAVVALPVPLIGPLAGAVVGASVAAFQKLTKD